MSVFTPVTEAELAEFLSEYDQGTLAHWQGIEAGTDNTNYFIDTELKGVKRQFVLTLFENLKAEQLPFFLALGDHFSANHCKVAEPIHDRQQQALHSLAGKPAVLFERLQGKHVPVPNQQHCQQIGLALGDMHQAVGSFQQQRSNPFGLAWLLEHQTSGAWGHPEDQALFVETTNQFKPFLDWSLPTGVIHGDLFHDNALFDHQENLAGVIDWYFAANDYLVLDLAIVLNDWCRHGMSFDSKLVDALVYAYNSRRPMQAIETDHLNLFQQMATCRFWLSRTLAWNVHGDTELEQVTVLPPEEMKNLLLLLREQ